MERINDVNPTGATSTYPHDFDPDEKLKDAFGLVYDDPLDVEIWFSATQARYIRERIWAIDQQIIDQDDGSIILNIKTSGRFQRWR